MKNISVFLVMGIFVTLALVIFSPAVSAQETKTNESGIFLAEDSLEKDAEDAMEKVDMEEFDVEEDAYEKDREEFFRGTVKTLDTTQETTNHIIQEAEIKITSGPFSEEKVTVDNRYEEEDPYTFKLEEDMEVILVNVGEGDYLEGVYIHDISRDRGLYLLIGLLILFLILLGGKKGIRAVITLAFTVFFILKVLLPLILQGYNPIMVSVTSAILLIIIILFIIAGINRKSLVAIGGTVVGVITAGLLAHWAGNAAHLTGFSSEEAQMLFYLDQDIDIRGLLFSGIIIGALGAVADVGISVSSAAEEIKQANPQVKTKELVKGALNVGRDVMATMSNTIILAYVGAAIPLLLLLLGMDTPWLNVINTDIIATEIVRSITVTMGFVVTVPVTAFLAGIALRKPY